MPLRVNGQQLRRSLEELSGFGRRVGGGITRTSYSLTDRQGRAWYAEQCAAAGLQMTVDGLGNIVVGPPSTTREPTAVWTGSHLDTVPDGGAFDGALGALAALECVRRIAESGSRPARPVRAVVFSDEEGNYGHLLGSGGLARGYSADELAGMVGRDGDRLVEALANCGFGPSTADYTRLPDAHLHAFVELHIEQGPRLEASAIDIGVVTGIVGLGGGTVEFVGRADHAGGTPMNARQDALLGAADFLAGFPALAAAVGQQSVLTAGNLRVLPGADNVVPGQVTVRLDFRDAERSRVDALGQAVQQAAAAAAARHHLRVNYQPDAVVDPVLLDRAVMAHIAESADRLGLRHTELASFAGHDSQNMATRTPTGMIFVPSKGGRSHCPEEETDWGDVERGANVLLQTLLSLAAD